MSITLSKGYKLPETGDRGFWTDLEFDISRLNAHKHDGSDSTLISAFNLDKSSQTLLAAAWTAVAGQAGTYKQTVTLPTGNAMSTILPRFLNPAGDDMLLSVRKVSVNSYDVFINDNTLDVTVIYG